MAALSVSISGRKAFSGVTKYVVCVFDGNSAWTVARRYNEFMELHKSVTGMMRGLPEMPEKPVTRKIAPVGFTSFSVQMKLMNMLQAVVAIDPSLSIGHLREFLGVPVAEKTAEIQDAVDTAAIESAAKSLYTWGADSSEGFRTEIVKQDLASGKLMFVDDAYDGASTATGSFESNFSSLCE